MKRKRLAPSEEVVAQDAQNDPDTVTADLASIIADLAHKREELESSINKSKDLEDALKKNAAERQRLIAECIAMGINGDIGAANTKVAALEAKVARLEADLQTKESEANENRHKCRGGPPYREVRTRAKYELCRKACA